MIDDAKENTTEIYIHCESLFQSIIADTYMFFMLFSVIGIGKYLNSQPMQWLGFIVFLLVIITKSTTKRKKFNNLDNAIKYLQELKNDKKND